MALSELTIPPDACCWGCGYSLQHLSVARCPECGEPFNPANPMSMRTDANGRYRVWVEVVPLIAFVVVSVGVAIGIIVAIDAVSDWTWVEPAGAIGFGGMAGLVARWHVRKRLLRDRPDPKRTADCRWTRWLLVLFGLMAAWNSVRTWECAHTNAYRVGPYQLTWSTDPTCRRLPDTPRHEITGHLAWYDGREPSP